MKIVVTGAGGFLGRYIAEDLKKEGHEVYNFSRSFYPELEKQGIKNLQGDLASLRDVRAALEGKDAVFHVASLALMWGRWEDYFQTNVVGTDNILTACKEFGISKLIYTSSPSVVFQGDDIKGADEDLPYARHHFSFYTQSKAMAEAKVLAANDGKNLLTVALRPHLIWGPRDHHLVPTLVKRAKQKKLRKIGQGKNKVDVIFVENASRAHLQVFHALQKDSPVCGKAYFLGQERPVILWDFVNQLLSLYGIPPLTRSISSDTAQQLGRLCEKTFRAFRIYHKLPPMTEFVALQMSRSHFFNHARAQKDFGYYPQIGIEEGLKKLQNYLDSSYIS